MADLSGADGDEEENEAVQDAARTVYSVAPEHFVACRTELARAAQSKYGSGVARRIGALRKPTRSAGVVNRHVHANQDAAEQLIDLGDRLRRAQADLDAALLRELSTERRALVAGLADRALADAEVATPSTALRDEVVATFDAAVADPAVATQLGFLSRPQRYSGFGVEPADGPGLTLVRGGKDTPRRSRPVPAPRRSGGSSVGEDETTAETAGSTRRSRETTSAERRRRQRAVQRARNAFDAAEADLARAEAAAHSEADRVRELHDEIADLQRELESAKQSSGQARRDARSAQSRRREARSALDRAERHEERREEN